MTIACRFGGVKRSYIECLLATFEEKRISSNNSKHTVHISHPTTIRIDFSGFNKGSNGHHYSNANTIYCGHKSHSEFTVLSACKTTFLCKNRDKDTDIWRYQSLLMVFKPNHLLQHELPQTVILSGCRCRTNSKTSTYTG